MPSPFDPNTQHHLTESKIVVALERIAEAFRVLLWNESKAYNLSTIQIQLLIFLTYHDQAKCSVSYLAREFNMTKPTISDSIKVLTEKKLVEKHDNPADSRSYTIKLTAKGHNIATHAAAFSTAIETPLSKLPDEQKQAMLSGLTSLIYDLNRNSIITVQRMCYTCSHYRATEGKHYCSLINAQLTTGQIRLDCPEHASVL